MFYNTKQLFFDVKYLQNIITFSSSRPFEYAGRIINTRLEIYSLNNYTLIKLAFRMLYSIIWTYLHHLLLLQIDKTLEVKNLNLRKQLQFVSMRTLSGILSVLSQHLRYTHSSL